MTQDNARYHGMAIALHWVMAIAILGMIASGWAAEYAPLEKDFKFQLVQLHKSFGVTLLLAVVLRIAVRLWKRPPALPSSLAPWEKKASHAGHLGLYLGMILMPLTGWIMVSASPYGLPTYVFNQFEWPHIPGLAGNDAWRSFARGAHTYVGFALAALVAVHVGAVIKHAVIDRENLLRRMLWRKS